MTVRLVAALGAALLGVSATQADWFGSGENRFEIPLVTIGDPGNPADTTGDPNPVGRVDYTYQIGRYEVPQEAIAKANALSVLEGDPLGITYFDRGPTKPATGLSWYESARFVNWLNSEIGYAPAYKFDAAGEYQLWEQGDLGYDADNPFRSTRAAYFLPSFDEWYKAAYYDPQAGVYWDYPTGSDAPPTAVVSGVAPGTAVFQQDGPADIDQAGGINPYGTYGQAGNVGEWQEGVATLMGEDPVITATGVKGVRGGDFRRIDNLLNLSSGFTGRLTPSSEPALGGLRIARIPEPSCAALAAFSALGFQMRRRVPLYAVNPLRSLASRESVGVAVRIIGGEGGW